LLSGLYLYPVLNPASFLRPSFGLSFGITAKAMFSLSDLENRRLTTGSLLSLFSASQW